MRASGLDRRSFLSTLAAAAAVPHPTSQDEPTEEPFGIGQIGLGFRGFQYFRLISEDPSARLVACGDLWSAHFNRIRELGVRTFFTPMFVKVLMMSEVDLVVLAVPDHLCSYMLGHALEWARPAIVEPPLTFHEEELAEIRRQQSEAGVPIFVGSQYAWSPLAARVRDWIEEGAIGSVSLVTARAEGFLGGRSPLPPRNLLPGREWSWFLNGPQEEYDPYRFFQWGRYSRFSVGPARRHLAHLLSILDAVMDLGDPLRADAVGHRLDTRHGADVLDQVAGMIEFSKTPLLQFSVSETSTPFTFSLVFHGEAGRIELTPFEAILMESPSPDLAQVSTWPLRDRRAWSEQAGIDPEQVVETQHSLRVVHREEYRKDPSGLYFGHAVATVRDRLEPPDPLRQDKLERVGYMVARSLTERGEASRGS